VLLRRAINALPPVNETAKSLRLVALTAQPHLSQSVRRHSGRHLAVVLLQHANGSAHLPRQCMHVQVPVHEAHGGVAVSQGIQAAVLASDGVYTHARILQQQLKRGVQAGGPNTRANGEYPSITACLYGLIQIVAHALAQGQSLKYGNGPVLGDEPAPTCFA